MFEFLRKSKQILALDLGTRNLRAITATTERGRPLILQASSEPVDPAVFKDPENREAIKQGLANHLAVLLGRMGSPQSRAAAVYSCLPGNKANLKQVKSVALQGQELANALSFEARKHAAVEGDWLMDFQVLREEEGDLQVLLAVAPSEAVRDHVDLLTRCGVKSPVIEAPALALLNAHLLGRGEECAVAPETLLFLHFGAKETHLALFRDKGLLSTREIPAGGDQFTSALAERLKLPLPDAEKLKIEQGMDHAQGAAAADDAPGRISLLTPSASGASPADDLLREVMRSVRFYAKETGTGRIDRCFLSGGPSADAGLRRRLAEALKCDVLLQDPFRGTHARHPVPESEHRNFVLAAGMAKRGVHDLFSDQLKQA